MLSTIESMTDIECKKWLMFSRNRAWLRNYWVTNFPEIAPKNSGEILYIIKYGVSPFCENDNHKTFKQFPKGYYTACSHSSDNTCACLTAQRKNRENYKPFDKEAASKKTRQTMLDRYGVDNAFKMPDHMKKTKATFNEKYGQPTLLGISEIQDKKKKTCLLKYGEDHYCKTQEYKEKVSKTNLAAYMLDNPEYEHIQDYPTILYNITRPDVIEKRKNTMISRHGVGNYFESPDNQLNINSDRKKKYGYENIGQRFLSPETYAILQDPELFKPYITGVSFEAAAVSLNTSAFTITRYIKKYDFLALARPGTGSVVQDSIQEWLESLGIIVMCNNRKIIAPKEIDLFLPEFNVGIEYNGIFHHTEISGKRGEHYHYEKYTACGKLGIYLMQICSTVYKRQPNVIKHFILDRIGMTAAVCASQCEVVEVSLADVRVFLQEHQIRNWREIGQYTIGLTYHGALFQVITFADRQNSGYELTQIATKQGFLINGGVAKMFNYFCDIRKPRSILSYCDSRYFTGNTLKTIGFEKIDDGAPTYWYTDYKKIYHKDEFTIDKLTIMGHNPLLTELENMLLFGYDILWDCGMTTWRWLG